MSDLPGPPDDSERALDTALEATFPASDPPSMSSGTTATSARKENTLSPISASADCVTPFFVIFDGDTVDADGLRGARRETEWCSLQTGLLRLALSPAEAVLDLLTSLEGRTPPKLWFVRGHAPAADVEEATALPEGWDALPCPESVRCLGDDWAGLGRHAALRVPSRICPGESVLLLNPDHARAECFAVDVVSAFALDARLRT